MLEVLCGRDSADIRLDRRRRWHRVHRLVRRRGGWPLSEVWWFDLGRLEVGRRGCSAGASYLSCVMALRGLSMLSLTSVRVTLSAVPTRRSSDLEVRYRGRA